MSYVKICGLTRAEHVDAAVAAGATAIGLVLARSPRRVSVDEARALARRAGHGVARVAVLRELDADAVTAALAAECTHLQAIGPASAFLALPSTLVPLPVLVDDADTETRFRELRALGHPVVFDSTRPGTGTAPSLQRAASLARTHPLILAGGLTPITVADAIASTRPFGVDVSSGVEGRPGEKDAELVHAFVRAARRALDSLRSLEVPS